MSTGTLDELDSALDSFDTKISKQEAEASKLRSDHKAHVSEFENIRALVIRPVFEKIGKHMESRGHSFRITEEERHGNHGASITIEIIPKGYTPDGVNNNHPSLGYYSGKIGDEKISTHIRDLMPQKGGSIGWGASYSTQNFTGSVVEKELTQLLVKCFS